MQSSGLKRRWTGRSRGGWATLALALLSALALCSGSAAATKPRLLQPDRALGGQGVVRADPGPAYAKGLSFSALTVEPDGSLLALRAGGSCCGAKAGLHPFHFTPTGRVDARITFPALRSSGAIRAVVGDPQGGWLRTVGYRRVQRLEADGAPDRTFDRFKSEDEPRGSEPVEFSVHRIVALPSGEVLVAGAGRVARFRADGTLDRGFGVDGEAFLGGAEGTPVKVAGLLADGHRTIVPANSPGPDGISRGPARVVALGPSGHPDPTFSPAVVPGPIVAFARRADGAVGFVWQQPTAHPSEPAPRSYLTVLEPDGTPDPSFGGGDGTAVLGLGGRAELHTMMFFRDGSIAVGGEVFSRDPRCRIVTADLCGGVPIVLRLGASGAPVRGFGAGGVARLGGLADRSRSQSPPGGVLSLAEDAAGDLVAAGGSGAAAFLTRLDATGAPVPGFGVRGTVVEREPLASGTGPFSVAVDSRGRILVAAESDARAVETGPTILRFLPDGRPDRTFGHAGLAKFGGLVDDVELHPDSSGGTYVAGASLEGEMWLTHLGPDGAPDRRFGTRGFVRVPLSAEVNHEVELNHFLAVLPDGDLLVAGRGGSNEERFDYHGPLELRRLSPAGHPVRGFGHDGVRLLNDPRLRHLVMWDLAPTPDGGALVSGSIREQGHRELAVAKFLPHGGLDPGFGRGGIATPRLSGDSTAKVVLARPDGSVLVAALHIAPTPQSPAPPQHRALVLRLGRDGSVLRRFGTYRTKGYQSGYEARVFAARISDLAVVGGHVFVVGGKGEFAESGVLLAYSLGGRPQGYLPISSRAVESTAAVTGVGRRLLVVARRTGDWTESDHRFTMRAFRVR